MTRPLDSPAAAGRVGSSRPSRPRTACRAFGIDVEVPPALGRLGLAPACGDIRRTKVEITSHQEIAAAWPGTQTEPVRTWREADGRVAMVAHHLPNHGYMLDAPQYGRIHVSPDGRSIRCAPPADGDEQLMSLLLGQGLPLASALHGLEPLHASAVVLDGAPIALAGQSRAGKTTLAAGMVASGARLLTDDVLALEVRDGRAVAHPGPSQLSLRPDTEPVLLAALARPGSISLRRPKIRLEVAHERRALPLGALYLLERRSRGTAAAIEPIDRLEPMQLLRHAYSSVVQTPARLLGTLEVCDVIARGVPTFMLHAPAGAQAEVAEMVTSHAGAVRPRPAPDRNRPGHTFGGR